MLCVMFNHLPAGKYDVRTGCSTVYAVEWTPMRITGAPHRRIGKTQWYIEQSDGTGSRARVVRITTENPNH
jgi:hypothetical protein